MAIEKYLNAWGKECYRGVRESTRLSDLEFHLSDYNNEDSFQRVLHTNLGTLTVLERLTGFGWWDVETGFRDPERKFWLASGECNLLDAGDMTVGEAVEWIKARANTCVGGGA